MVIGEHLTAILMRLAYDVDFKTIGRTTMESNGSLLFSALRRSPLRPSKYLSPRLWTLVGAIAVPLWATWPALSLGMREIPTFEGITFILSVSWLVMACLTRTGVRRNAASAQDSLHSWIPALAFAMGESGATVFFVLATHHIGATEANLISDLWPGLTVGLGAVLGIFHLRPQHILGIILGFVGAAILMAGSALSLSYAGIGLALLGATSWAGYCFFRLKWNATPGPILARGFALSTILCGVLHFLFEPSVAPTIGAAAAAAVIGIIPGALANWAWDEGFRRGDGQLLAVMAYGTPLCSAILLTALGLELFTWRLLIGASVIVAAGVLSRADR